MENSAGGCSHTIIGLSRDLRAIAAKTAEGDWGFRDSDTTECDLVITAVETHTD